MRGGRRRGEKNSSGEWRERNEEQVEAAEWSSGRRNFIDSDGDADGNGRERRTSGNGCAGVDQFRAGDGGCHERGARSDDREFRRLDAGSEQHYCKWWRLCDSGWSGDELRVRRRNVGAGNKLHGGGYVYAGNEWSGEREFDFFRQRVRRRAERGVERNGNGAGDSELDAG